MMATFSESDRQGFQPGDILACWGADRVSRMISAVTSSVFAHAGLRLGPSHVGVVASRGEDNPYLVESTSLSNRECTILRERVAGLQVNPIPERVGDYVSRGGAVDVYRLTELNQLNAEESSRLWITCRRLVESRIGYDTVGAGLSGTRIFSLLKFFPDAEVSRLFCSEFIAWLLQAFGRMNRDNPGRYNPARLLRELVRTGVYRREFGYRQSGNVISLVNFQGVK